MYLGKAVLILIPLNLHKNYVTNYVSNKKDNFESA